LNDRISGLGPEGAGPPSGLEEKKKNMDVMMRTCFAFLLPVLVAAALAGAASVCGAEDYLSGESRTVFVCPEGFS
jgi:hypothetical protein